MVHFYFVRESLRPREIKKRTQDHTDSKWQGWNLTPKPTSLKDVPTTEPPEAMGPLGGPQDHLLQ